MKKATNTILIIAIVVTIFLPFLSKGTESISSSFFGWLPFALWFTFPYMVLLIANNLGLKVKISQAILLITSLFLTIRNVYFLFTSLIEQANKSCATALMLSPIAETFIVIIAVVLAALLNRKSA